MTEARKWELCILCQKETEEQLVCPLANPVASRRVGAYKEIINLVSQFRAIGAAPHPDVDELMQKMCASWHKSCRQLYRSSAFEYAKKHTAREGLPGANRRSCRTEEPVNRNLCLFCAKETRNYHLPKRYMTRQLN
jgi:hypothetical protein